MAIILWEKVIVSNILKPMCFGNKAMACVGQLLVPVDSLACLVRGLALKKGQDVVLLSQNLYKLMTKCP